MIVFQLEIKQRLQLSSPTVADAFQRQWSHWITDGYTWASSELPWPECITWSSARASDALLSIRANNSPTYGEREIPNWTLVNDPIWALRSGVQGQLSLLFKHLIYALTGFSNILSTPSWAFEEFNAFFSEITLNHGGGLSTNQSAAIMCNALSFRKSQSWQNGHFGHLCDKGIIYSLSKLCIWKGNEFLDPPPCLHVIHQLWRPVYQKNEMQPVNIFWNLSPVWPSTMPRPVGTVCHQSRTPQSALH